MSLQERIYSVLVVSSAEKFNNALPDVLPETRYQPVRLVSSVSSGRRAWSERSYDMLIINSPLPDDAGVRFAIDTASSSDTAVMLLLRSEVYDEVTERVSEHGIFTLSKPFTRSNLSLSLRWMEAMRERLRRLEKKAVSFEEKMEEIKLVNRAKWILIDELKMDEPQAHRYIEKQAMDRCIQKRDVAMEIIRTYS